MINRYIPYPFFKFLWGDRRGFGIFPNEEDPEWKAWLERASLDFYSKSRKEKGLGRWIIHLPYNIVSIIDFNKTDVLEIGPGEMPHLIHIRDKPRNYVICDIEEKYLPIGKKRLRGAGISFDAVLLERGTSPRIPFPDESFDIILSFKTLEHIYLLEQYLTEINRLLKPDGTFIGGIPCEGGLMVGMVRFLTTRRQIKRLYDLNYDKILCWEHPNFADSVIKHLDRLFNRLYIKRHPFQGLPMDFNLAVSFVYKRK